MTAKKVVTVRKAIALGIGSMVGAGIFALLGEAAALAGSAVWISFMIAGIIALLSGYSFVQMGVRFPSRGGIVVTADDTVYISDVNAGAVNIVRNGELIESIPVAARAHGLSVDPDGTIYVSDSRERKVIRITRTDSHD